MRPRAARRLKPAPRNSDRLLTISGYLSASPAAAFFPSSFLPPVPPEEAPHRPPFPTGQSVLRAYPTRVSRRGLSPASPPEGLSNPPTGKSPVPAAPRGLHSRKTLPAYLFPEDRSESKTIPVFPLSKSKQRLCLYQRILRNLLPPQCPVGANQPGRLKTPGRLHKTVRIGLWTFTFSVTQSRLLFSPGKLRSISSMASENRASASSPVGSRSEISRANPLTVVIS